MLVNGEWRRVRILLGGFLADLEEQYHLLNQKAAASNHPDIRYLVPHGQLTNLRGEYALRTEAQQQQVNALKHSTVLPSASHQPGTQPMQCNAGAGSVEACSAAWSFNGAEGSGQEGHGHVVHASSGGVCVGRRIIRTITAAL